MLKNIAVVALLFVASQANALIYESTLVIPQFSKIQRYSHRTGAAAARSDRKTVGGDISFEDTEVKTNGTKVGDNEETIIRPFFFNKFSNGMVLEAELPIEKTKEDNVVASDNDSDSRQVSLVGGWVLPDSKWALGVTLSTENEEFDDGTGGTLDTDTNTIGFSASTKLTDSMYLGFSLNRGNDEAVNGNITTKHKNDDESSVGLGWINGDGTRPSSAIETSLSYSNESGSKAVASLSHAVFNLNDMSQIVAEFILGYTGRSEGSDSRYGVAGIRYDYQFESGLYLAPELEYAHAKFSGDDKSVTIDPALELGLRRTAFVVFAKVSSTNEKLDASTTEVKTTGTKITAGGQYYF